MTKDEALKRAFEAKDARRDFLLTHSTYDVHEIDRKVNAAFLSSLRESGWTLAPVEATEEMIEAGYEWVGHRHKVERCYRAMLAAQEDESNG
jgi:hypothetical protein